MKILLATSRAARKGTGIPSYNYELCKALSRNHDIYLLSDADEHNVEGYIRTYSTHNNSTSDYSYAEKLISKINQAEYDCIINSSSAFIPILAPFLKAPIIGISHFINGKLAIKSAFNAEYLNGIVSLSEYGKQYLIKKFDIKDSEKIRVIYNSVEDKPVKYKNKSHNHPLRIVYPGGTSIMKSVDVIQELVYRLSASNLDFEFIWIGGTKLPIAQFSLLHLKKTPDLFKTDPRVTITGLIPQEESVDIISSANIFLLPSRGEGCPMTLLEAMREGCIPIVSDAHHGSRELLENANTGYIVKQDSSFDLFNCISKILVSPDSSADMYQTTRDFLKSNLSNTNWENQMNEFINFACKRDKKYIPLTHRSFQTSFKTLKKLYRIERIKEISRSIYYRIKLDLNYIKYKLGLFKSLEQCF